MDDFFKNGQYPENWRSPSDLQEDERQSSFGFEGSYKDYLDLLGEFGQDIENTEENQS